MPYLRQQGGGRIVQLSSEGGQIAYPSFSLYHATQWGIEGFIESVALEVAPFGIDFLIAFAGNSSSAAAGHATLRAMPSTKIDVVAAIIEREGRFLFGKRSQQRPKAPGYWCPISGRVEAGESQSAAVVREVREETGLAVEAVEKVDECPTHDGSALIHWWRVRLLSEAPARLANDEHSELAWVTLAEMRRLEPVFLEDVAIIARAAMSGAVPQAEAESAKAGPGQAESAEAEPDETRPREAGRRRGGPSGAGTLT